MNEKNTAEQEFERWRELREPELRRESFVTAWAKVAYLAEGQMHRMGRELAKLQYRIGRQRKANRELRNVLRLREEELEACRRVVPTDEMRRLARYAWDDGTYGEPATTLASYVLALLGEPPFPVQDADSDERRTL